MKSTSNISCVTMDEYVEAFEQAWRTEPVLLSDVVKYLPPPSHSEYDVIATELLRIDIERRRVERNPPTTKDYWSCFPSCWARKIIASS